MEEIVLALICQEYDIEESFLLSNRKFDVILNALATMTFMLVTDYDKTVIQVHDFYVKKGMNRSRSALYHHIKICKRRDMASEAFREIRASIINGVELAQEKNITHTASNVIYETKGRVISKLVALDNISNIISLEKQIDNLLKAEFLNTKQFEEKTKTWLA